MAAVALECKPLAMQIVPFGSLKDLGPLRIQQNWKQILIKDVENGKRLTRFGWYNFFLALKCFTSLFHLLYALLTTLLISSRAEL